MPGLAMDPSQVSDILTQPSLNDSSPNDARDTQHIVKTEYDNIIDDDARDEDTYRPRPQLPQPFVFMRTLSDLISR
jgi:hypothetical protein